MCGSQEEEGKEGAGKRRGIRRAGEREGGEGRRHSKLPNPFQSNTPLLL